MAELKSLKYAELRRLAKNAGIKANQKHEVLVAELTKYYEKQAEKDKMVEKSGRKSKDGLTAKRNSSKSPAVRSKTTPEQINQRKSDPTSKHASSPRPGKTVRLVTPKLTGFTIPVESKNRSTTPKTSNLTPKSARSTPTQSRLERKVLTPTSSRKTFTPKTNTPTINKDSGKRKRKGSVSTPEPQPKKHRSTFEKAPTPNLKTPEIEGQGKNEDKRLSSRKGSPGVKEMLGAMKSSMNDKEMKESLMSVIDKKVQEKCKNGETSISNAGSNIPRFAAFLKKRQESKPITPGNKDWNKIHKKNFDKFDSIDVYLQKKRKRAEEIASSAKKVKTISQEMTSAMKKLKAHKTPEVVENKFKKPRLSNPNKTTPFLPTVFNTKNMNLNFNARKTPTTLPRKSPNPVLGKERNENKATARKSTGTGVPRKSMTTPFKFTGGNTLNTTITSTKKSFNLKESLSKPLNYKPHKGKLKPYEQTGPTYLSAVSATKATQNRENIKMSIAQRRAQKKMNSVMSRRGIKM